GQALFDVLLVDDPIPNADTLALIDSLKGDAVKGRDGFLGYLDVVVPLNADAMAQIAARPDVVSIAPYTMPRMLDERADQIVAGNWTGMVPPAPGYPAGLASKGFTQAAFTASGLVVDVSDSGIDNGTTPPNHFALHVGGLPANASRVAYTRLEGTPNVGSTLQ